LTVVLHLEGAECIGADLEGLDTLYDAGLRSLGPVWSRPNAFAHGVPFRSGSDGDTGPGLTEAGRALVRECHARGHGRRLQPHHREGVLGHRERRARHLWPPIQTPVRCRHDGAKPDRRATASAVGETGGMVGLNFGTMFLRPDGKRAPEGGIGFAVRHLAHMVEMAGEDHVGLGSDFDGAPMPEGLGSAAELQNLVDSDARRPASGQT
jgi:membrane dipeptidase